MDTTVLHPAPGQSVVATSGHRHEDRRHHDKELEQVIARGVDANGRAIGDAKYDVTAAVERAAIANLGQTADIRREVANEAGSIKVHADGQFARTQKDISDVAYETLGGFKDAQALAYQVEGRALLEAAKNANALGVQADKNWYQTNLQAQTNAAAAVLLATQNQAAALAFAAECCCETKELITAEAIRTRDLITQLDTNRIRDELAACKAQNIAYFTRNIPPVVPG